MFCRKCGLELFDNAKSCFECGEKTGIEGRMKTVFCRKCGVELFDNAKSCPECGEQTDIESNAQTSKEKEAQETRSTFKGVLMVVGLLIAIWLTYAGLTGFWRALG